MDPKRFSRERIRERASRSGDLFSGIFDNLFRTLDMGFDFGEPGVATDDSPWPNVKIDIGLELAIINVELAGYERESLELEIEGSIITISGSIDGGSGFTKTFQVNTEQFDIDSVKAGYKNGLLTITLDRVKKAETEKRTVTIQ